MNVRVDEKAASGAAAKNGAVVEARDITRRYGEGDTELTKLRRRHIGFIFQFFNLLPMLSAEENIVLPVELAGAKPDKGWSDEVIEKVGLSDRRTHRPAE